MISHIKAHRDKIFPQLANHLFDTTEDQPRAKSPEERGEDAHLLGLLRFDPSLPTRGPNGKRLCQYRLLPPILYKDGRTDVPQNLFLEPSLIRVCIISLSSCIRDLLTRSQMANSVLFGDGSGEPDSKSRGMKYHVSESTPGFVALMAILVCILILISIQYTC